MSEELQDTFQFQIGAFEGSLDLLLFLIRKHQMDIRDIQIALIADEFASYVEKMHRIDVFIASDFLVMASTLMELKSKALLAKEEDQEEFRNAKAQLENQLQEYEQMKQIVTFLDSRYEDAQKRFGAIVRNKILPKDRTRELPKKLLEIFRSAYNELKLREKVYRVKGERYSLTSRVRSLTQRLQEEGDLEFRQLLSESEDRISLIVTFLAILEIVKLGVANLEEREADGHSEFWIVTPSK
jgi:segregation and condensation protein A